MSRDPQRQNRRRSPKSASDVAGSAGPKAREAAHRRQPARVLLVLGIVLGLAVAGLLSSRRPDGRDRVPAPGTAAGNGSGTGAASEAAPLGRETPLGEFAGSDACAACHAREYTLWKHSTHGQAGGRPGEVPIIARFDGQPLRFSDAVVTPVTNRAGELRFLIDEPGEARQEIRVDAVVGGGLMHGGGTQSFFTRFEDGTYRFLPFDFIRRENLWFVQLRRDLTWVPISPAISLREDLANWPPRRVLGTASEFSNCQNCHGSQITLAQDDKAGAYQTRFQTLRINCESCHGPGQRHISIVSRDGWQQQEDLGLRALATAGKQESMNTCHQCHAAKDALRDDPYLPGARLEDYFSLRLPQLTGAPFRPDGRVRTFSYQSNHEYSDCYLNGSMTCTDCHDPHSQGYRDVFGKPLAGRFDNGQCTGCHASKAIAPEAHSHHAPGTAGNLCVSCHMPYLQHQGVGQHLTFARSDHSIPIPRPAFDSQLGIENACQKCHRDKDLAWQQSNVDRWYGALKPHPPLIAALAATNRAPSAAAAAARYLDPGARHPMAQAAGLARFIEEQVQPDQPNPDPQAVERLLALAANPDPDLQAIAVMALQVGFSRHPAARAAVEARRQALEPDGPAARRWAIAADHVGGLFGQRGDLDAAMACFQRALEVQPRNEVVLSHLALAQLRAGLGDDAVATLRRAIDTRPTKAVLHFQLAQVCLQLQRRPEAIAALEAGLRQAPNDPTARALLQQLRGP